MKREEKRRRNIWAQFLWFCENWNFSEMKYKIKRKKIFFFFDKPIRMGRIIWAFDGPEPNHPFPEKQDGPNSSDK